MTGFLGWMLESSLLVLMILGIRKIFMGKIRYAGIYALWLVVLLRFMIPVNFISTPFSVGTIISDTFSLPNAEDFDFSTKNLQKTVPTDSNLNRKINLDTSGEYSQLKSEDDQGESTQQGVGNAKNRNIQDYLKIGSANWHLFLVSSWLIVSGILFLWFLLSNVFLIRKLRRKRVLFGMRDNVKIYAVCGIRNPCLYGFIRPVIYLPKKFISSKSEMGVGKEEIEQMITHEYVHYQHRDHIWAMLRTLLICIYWFNPFLWLAVTYSKKDAELYCDETVIRLLGEDKRFSYGKMLIRLAGEANWGEFRYPLMAMSRRGKEMEVRIRAISNRRHYRRWIVLPLVIVVSAAVGITCSAGIGPLAREEKTADERVEKGSVISGTALVSVGEGKEQAEEKTEQKTTTPVSGKSVSGNVNSVDTKLPPEADTDSNSKVSSVNASTFEKVFQQYIEIFTDAVNTGNTEKMSQVLYVGSDVYEQQCNIVKNYYRRGIREEIKSYSISSAKEITSNCVELYSKEKIKVFYVDNTTKVIKQKYCYTCEYINQTWRITKMEEITR